MFRPATWLMLVLLVTQACRRESPPAPPKVVEQPVATQSPDVSVSDATAGPDGRVTWTVPRVAQRGPRLTMRRGDNGLELDVGASTLSIGPPTFGDCTEQLPTPPAPDSLPAVKDSSRSVWATLKGEDDEAALMLTTTGATLVIDDGCMRSADITTMLLGQEDDVEDPVFTADGLVGDRGVVTKAFTWSDGTIHEDDTPITTVRGFEGQTALEAWTVDASSYLRFSILDETLNDQKDSVVGRDHTSWLHVTDAVVEPIVQADVRFGAEGPDHDDSHTVMKWRVMRGSATTSVDAERLRRADALNVGAGRCPEMEGAIIFERIEESVVWAFADSSGKRVPIGTATRNATYASGCVNVAEEELRARKKTLFDAVPKTPVEIE